MKNNFWERVHNEPINKQALKEFLETKDDQLRIREEYGSKTGYNELPLGTCTDKSEWGKRNVNIGDKIGDLTVVGRIKRPPKDFIFYAWFIRKHGEKFCLEKDHEFISSERKKFNKNYTGNHKAAYVFRCVCGRYCKWKLRTLQKKDRAYQCCSHCHLQKLNRGELKP